MERFDARRVAFVSVTQQFNTASSMGRLVLHILLSFAQFEREMIAERTRDKMSAARRKGKWVGGTPVLGYDVDPKGGRLVVNDDEAARVREIFDLYLREHSLVGTAATLNLRGWTLKSWTTRKGRAHAGARFTRANLHALLTNVLYAGQVRHKGTIYPGEHASIVPPETFRRANELLRGNGRSGGARPGNKHGALLKSLVRCAPCDAAMVHTYTVQRARRYRYYVCLRAQKEGWASCRSKAVPAVEIERFVVDRIRGIGRDPNLLAAALAEARRRHQDHVAELVAARDAAESELRALDAETRRAARGTDAAATDRLADLQERTRAVERRLTETRERHVAAEGEAVDAEDLDAALALFDPVWDALFPREQARILALLVEGVRYDGGAGTLAVTFRPSGIRALADEVRAAGEPLRIEPSPAAARRGVRR
jgi:site-specific DNA recombinase